MIESVLLLLCTAALVTNVLSMYFILRAEREALGPAGRNERLLLRAPGGTSVGCSQSVMIVEE